MEGTDLTQPASNSKMTPISRPGRTGEPGRDNQLQTWVMSRDLSAATGSESFLSYCPESGPLHRRPPAGRCVLVGQVL